MTLRLLLIIAALLSLSSAQAKTFYFPHFGDGAGFRMLFVITNNSNSIAIGKLSIFDSAGSPSPLPFEGDSMAVVPLSLPPNGSVLLRSLGTSSPVKSGFVRVELDQNQVSGLAIFQMDSGIEAGVLPSTLATRFTLFVERSGSLDTGVAIMGEEPSSITLTLHGLDGQEAGSRVFELSERQAARFLSELMPDTPVPFQGSLELESESAFAVLGLRFGGEVLSTLPINKLPALWRGLVVAPENRCSDYSSRDYRYSSSVEDEIVEQIGSIYGPYTGTCFESTRETDIEHIVARSEAHDSGLCSADDETRKSFASDLLNFDPGKPGGKPKPKAGQGRLRMVARAESVLVR